MNLKEALISLKWFTRDGSSFSRYYMGGTGPKSNLVSCDYFLHKEGEIEEFSTSIDLYAEDILADDYLVVDDKI